MKNFKTLTILDSINNIARHKPVLGDRTFETLKQRTVLLEVKELELVTGKKANKKRTYLILGDMHDIITLDEFYKKNL